ncbi:hypothetical protein TELCIR_21039 [Teladorsagia circumcincta]|uniref:SXP/RAL-2 family protein Ani s 5-like cation-binding domain-containing protein n=1 Tax=Teladorsagia circumcincta TaxID=45464 RepID=A0A2G9THW0_TELCI|nr:hypothetical protein TELCIR_21039 [Teladorsagia circumcincta]
MTIIFILLLAAGVATASRYTLGLQYVYAPFLANLTKEGKAEYSAILSNKKITYDQLHEKIVAWANKYKRTEELKKFNAKMDEKLKQLKEHVSKTLASLPAAFNEYTNTAESKGKTRLEIMMDLKKLQTKNPEVQKKKSTEVEASKRLLQQLHNLSARNPKINTSAI